MNENLEKVQKPKEEKHNRECLKKFFFADSSL